ncbi:hypothetical protein JCM19296_1601 [Nonlabens ulvanivorans]|uniref:Uncharacterized protein n=1 Tax=Nonlabens ulvanivorans TaxID=906888 RepID=A0A081DAQ8_NONUL|nr:hypothetical protein JCM19296_1601 [Nonlabens ulvanivorans]
MYAASYFLWEIKLKPLSILYLKRPEQSGLFYECIGKLSAVSTRI